MKTIHVAEVMAEGGRDGRVEAPEGAFAVDLSSDERTDATTPEHLFAGAYGACFLAELKRHAETAHLPVEGFTLVCRAHLEENDREQSRLQVDLLATLPGIGEGDARHLMNLAHQTCLYSKATRGNVTVNLSFD